jgi:hypothetical protein
MVAGAAKQPLAHLPSGLERYGVATTVIAIFLALRYRIRPMRRLRAIRIVFTLLATASRLLAQSQAGEDLLNRSLGLVDIRAEGSPAFHMRATVQLYEKGKPSSQARYDLKWRTPSTWREEIEVGNLRQIRIAEADKLWEQRNLPYFTPAIEQIEKVTEFPQHIRLLGSERAGVVRERAVNGIRVHCVDVKEGNLKVKSVCLQRDSDFPVRVDYSGANGGGGFRYEDLIPLSKHQYPRVIQDFDENPVLEFRVEELALMGAGDDEAFLVPPGARSYGWCPNPTQAEPLEEIVPIPPEIAPKIQGERAVIYGVIGTDGQWHDLAVVESSGRVSESVWFSLVRSRRFRPARCGGTPVETEQLTKFRGE